MKLFLTGEPGSGKTTLLEDFIGRVPNKQGFVTREVRQNGERTGFELVSSTGQIAILASVTSDSKTRVSKYGVEVERLDGFLAELPPLNNGTVLYIDEIGQMELFSDNFKRLVSGYFDSGNTYVGTISSVFKDDFIERILNREDIILLSINQDNRGQIRDVLNGLAQNIGLLNQLSPDIQAAITGMAKDYAQSARFIQLRKLFKNAVKYIAEARVGMIDANTYRVSGNTNEHTVTHSDRSWTCDCDLFKGEGAFRGNAGECSHIQATKLFLVPL